MNEFTARTVAEAIAAGLQALQLTTETAKIEIIDEGHSGVFGLGARPAVVRISPLVAPASPETTEASSPEPQATPEPAPVPAAEITPSADTAGEEEDDAATSSAETEATPEDDENARVLEMSKTFLQKMLDLMHLQTQVQAEIQAPQQAGDDPVYYLNIEGEDLGILIGRRGETLNAIQYLVRLYANRHLHYWPRIEIDVEGYKQRRVHTLQKLALTMADRAVQSGKTVVLEAMPARERRLIHLALRDREDVTTQSIGEGENRKVTIIPQN